MYAGVTSTNVHNTELLLEKINKKLEIDFHYSIDIDGFELFQLDLLDVVLESDIDALWEANKAAIIWHNHFVDANGLLEIALDRYKNMNDIYDYLMFLSINNTDEFTLVAPKYKIDTTNLPYAVKDLEQKQKALKDFIKDIKTVMARFESYDQLSIAGYYKTSKNIRAINRRMKNTSFAQI